MTKRKKPSVKTKCVANNYTEDNERIVEFMFHDGTGGLISLFTNTETGENSISIYRVTPAGKDLPELRVPKGYPVYITGFPRLP